MIALAIHISAPVFPYKRLFHPVNDPYLGDVRRHKARIFIVEIIKAASKNRMMCSIVKDGWINGVNIEIHWLL